MMLVVYTLVKIKVGKLTLKDAREHKGTESLNEVE